MVMPCTTQEHETGFCMSLSDCLNSFNLTDNKKAQKYFKKSKCGSKKDNRKNPKVCCDTQTRFLKLKFTKKFSEKEVFPQNCGRQNVTVLGRILGGKKAILGEFPWMARLIHRESSESRDMFGCTGFLITSKYVLTAAHCLTLESQEQYGPL